MIAQTSVIVTIKRRRIYTTREGGSHVKIANRGSQTAYIGGVGAGADNGLPLAKGITESFEFAADCSIYAVTAAETTSLVILEY